MSYNEEVNYLNKVEEENQKIQNNINNLIELYKQSNIILSEEDEFTLNELKNKFKFDFTLTAILLNINIMNYSLYMKSLDKRIEDLKKEISK